MFYDPSFNRWSTRGTYLDPIFLDERGKLDISKVGCLNGAYNDRSHYRLFRRRTGEEHCDLDIIPMLRKGTMRDTRLLGHGWAPTASATVYFSNSARAYARYAEFYRFPSIFEATSGFSLSLNPIYRLRPEHLHSLEAAYIQDLRPLFRVHDGQKADFRLTWYRNITTDVIDRDTNLQSSNLDKQILSGIEAQARYDSGSIFADIGYAHVFTNRVCDETRALITDTTALGRIPTCVKYGFYTGYLLTQAAPDDSLNLTLGARLLDRRLEFGPRVTWYSQYKNALLDTLLNSPNPVSGYALNVPYAWGKSLTVDAYVRFRVDDRFTAELNGTNLTDHYYSDPLSRTLNPSPGRTLRLSLTGRL
jgi:hemoglobin/transferrin/lactoferrin receptor protein